MNDVTSWLLSLGIEEHAPAFAAHVDGLVWVETRS